MKTPRENSSLFRSLGPAIIVACVVLGPGSILATSTMGWKYGYDMVWILATAVLLMIGMTALSARLGVSLDGTLCEELARRAGRPLAVLTGVSLFLVAACFQFGNNLGVLYAMEPFLESTRLADSAAFPVTVLVLLNGGVVIALFGLRRLYVPVERLMKLLVGLMFLGFAANLLLARPSILATLTGLVPSLPEEADTLLPHVAPEGEAGIVDPLWAVQALIGTTFSVGGAFYQSYLVRQKGWTSSDLKTGLTDTIVGITILGVMSMMIMVTAASVLHANPQVKELKSAADVARQLEPLFGGLATGLFCLGIFAGAFSSFLVNAMIGGTILSDGLGRGGSMDGIWPRALTVVVLAVGFLVAIGIRTADLNTGKLIIFAQAITVLVNPLLAGVMLWLATRKDVAGQRTIPAWMMTLAVAGSALVLVLSVRTGYRLYLQITSI